MNASWRSKISPALSTAKRFGVWLIERAHEFIRARVIQSWRVLRSLPWRRFRFLIWVFVSIGSVVGALYIGSIYPEKFWVAWEATGLVFTLLYSVLMGIVWFFDKPPMNKMLISPASGRFLGCLALMILLLVFTLYVAIREWPPVLHAFLLVAISLASLAAQLQIRDYPEEELKESAAYLFIRREALNTIAYSEKPTLFTFSTLLLFTVVGLFALPRHDVEVFLGGSISFQLLLSNIIFGINYAFPRPITNIIQEY